MMNFYSVLLFFFIFGLFNVNSCDCCNGNKSSKSSSSAAKSGSPLIDISGKTIEELEKFLIIGVDELTNVQDDNLIVLRTFLKTNIGNLEVLFGDFFKQKKIRVFYKAREGGCTDVITFVSSDVVSSLCFDINNANLHKLNNQIYYFYYWYFNSITIANNGNAFANLDISKLKWND